MPTRTRLCIASAAVTATLALSGCSSDSDDKPDAPASSAEAKADKGAGKEGEESAGAKDDGKSALEESVRSYTKALFSGDRSGYELLSKRCKEQMSESEFATMAKQAHNDYGSLTIKKLSVDKISGDLARVSYGVGVPQFERKAQPWAKEGGTWRWDACPASGQ